MDTNTNETFHSNLKRFVNKSQKRIKEDNRKRFDILRRIEADDFTEETFDEALNMYRRLKDEDEEIQNNFRAYFWSQKDRTPLYVKYGVNNTNELKELHKIIWKKHKEFRHKCEALQLNREGILCLDGEIRDDPNYSWCCSYDTLEEAEAMKWGDVLTYEQWLAYVEEQRNEEACQEEIRKYREANGLENKVSTMEEWMEMLEWQKREEAKALNSQTKATEDSDNDSDNDRKPSATEDTKWFHLLLGKATEDSDDNALNDFT